MQLTREVKLASAIGLTLVAIGCVVGLIYMASTMYKCPCKQNFATITQGDSTVGGIVFTSPYPLTTTPTPARGNTTSPNSLTTRPTTVRGNVVTSPNLLTTRPPTTPATSLPIATTAGSKSSTVSGVSSVFHTTKKPFTQPALTPSSAGQKRPISSHTTRQTFAPTTTRTQRSTTNGGIVFTTPVLQTRKTTTASGHVTSPNLLTTRPPTTPATRFPVATTAGSKPSPVIGVSSVFHTTKKPFVQPALTSPSEGQNRPISSNATRQTFAPTTASTPRSTTVSGIAITTHNLQEQTAVNTSSTTASGSLVTSSYLLTTRPPTTPATRLPRPAVEGASSITYATTAKFVPTVSTPALEGQSTPFSTSATNPAALTTDRPTTESRTTLRPSTVKSSTSTVNPETSTGEVIQFDFERSVNVLSHSNINESYVKNQFSTPQLPMGKRGPLPTSENESKGPGTTVGSETLGFSSKWPENRSQVSNISDSSKKQGILKVVVYLEGQGVTNSTRNKPFKATKTFYVDVGMRRKGILKFNFDYSLNE